MNKSLSFFFVLVSTAVFAGENDLALIPLPQKVEVSAGVFELDANTKIVADFGSRKTAEFLTERIRQSTGYPVKNRLTWFSSSPVANAILLTTKSVDANLGPEGYALSVSTNSIVIRAPTQAGLFYGVQTLLQLSPPEIFSANSIRDREIAWTIPSVQITDWPRFKWRGFMLDVSRHFYTKVEVEKILDTMALYKLNTFHWHLVDDQGWRIEIKKYPKLTEIGAWRDSVGFGLATNSTTAYGADGRYGGFYTQDDIREVVAYAAARHITIVPEIEMPGHSLAALAAYPQFGCPGNTFTIPTKGGVLPGIYDPANEATYQFLDDVLAEVFQLFPGKYIHLGGDEVPKETWKKSAGCQALMQREGLKDEDELQSWFLRRMEKFVNANGKTLLGWSEIMHGGVAPSAVVMDWIGGGKEAASAGHDVVMTPTGFCYLDYYQSTNHATEPKAIGGFLPLEKTYALDPIPAGLPLEYQSHILGGQANLWTEFIPDLNHVEYMMFPRLCALAEVTWSPKSSHDWDDFKMRVVQNEKRLDAFGVNYRREDLDQK
jgi:hexosaminidase